MNLHFSGPNMPYKANGLSMVPLGNGQAICGGRFGDASTIAEYSNQIILLTCSNKRCKMEILPQKLLVSMAFFIMIPIPDTISGCVSKGMYIIITRVNNSMKGI